MEKTNVLVANLQGESNNCSKNLIKILSSQKDFNVDEVYGVQCAKERIDESTYQIVIPVVRPVSQSLRSIHALATGRLTTCTIVVFDGYFDDDSVELTSEVIDDFILWPATKTEVLARVRRFTKESISDEVKEASRNLLMKYGLKNIVGRNSKFHELLLKVQQIAKYDVPVLLYGQSGTGKELFARATHYLSPRASKPFIAINCAAIPAELFENELFGHVKGAFTGSVGQQDGLIKAADGGTLFLDEIDSISAMIQAKLLRFLENKEFKPLGLNKVMKADVRIIAAAKKDLRKLVDDDIFRDDLFYRLNVVPLRLPALKERKDDIPRLVDHFIKKFSAELSKKIAGLGPGVLNILLRYTWPGNVRELQNVILHAVAVCKSTKITLGDIELPDISDRNFTSKSFSAAKAEVIANFEQQYITDFLIANAGNISRAASAAQKHRRAFWELMRKHNIDCRKFIPGA